MHDHWLIAIALTFSALGLIALLILLPQIEPEESTITTIKEAQIGAPIRTKATIKRIEQRGEITILTLEQPTTIEGVIFTPVNITQGSCVLVTGKADEYEGKRQIIIGRIQEC